MPAFHVFSENVLELANNKSECRSQKHSAINCNFIQLHLQKVEFMKREETSNPESHSFLKAATFPFRDFIIILVCLSALSECKSDQPVSCCAIYLLPQMLNIARLLLGQLLCLCKREVVIVCARL